MLILIGFTFIANTQIELLYEAPSNSAPVLVVDNSVKNAVVNFLANATSFSLYNLDNSLFRECTLPAGVSAGSSWWVSCPTLSLFDYDSTNFECIIVKPAGAPEGVLQTWVV